MKPALSSSSFTFASTSEESFSLMSDAEAASVGREQRREGGRESQRGESSQGHQEPGPAPADEQASPDVEEEEVVEEETEEEEQEEKEGEEQERQQAQQQGHAGDREHVQQQTQQQQQQQQQQHSQSSQQQHSEQPQQQQQSSKEPARETGPSDKKEDEQPSTTPEAAHHEERETMQKAEFDLEAASRDMFGKLNSAVGGVLGQLTQHPPAAGSSLSKFAEGLTSGLSSGLGWWNSADSESQSRNRLQELTAKPPQSLSKDSALLQLFGLSEDEQVVEQFPCKMLQTYGCRHNTFTPVLQMAFQGTMYLTDRHMCFSIEERGKQLPIKVPLSSIKRATRQLPVQKGAGDLLHLELENKDTYIAFRFESGSTLDSALALIEHLTES